MRSLLATQSIWLILGVGTAITLVASLAALIVVRRRWPQLGSGGANDLTNAALTVAGTLYAIILGFGIVNAYTVWATTESTVRAEATELAEVYRDTRGLPGLAEPVAREIGLYVHEVVEVEWPLMRAGEVDLVSNAHLDTLFTILHEWTPTSDRDAIWYQEAIGKLNDVIGARRLRLESANEEMPLPLRALLVTGAALLVGLFLLFGVESQRVHVLVIGGLAALLAFTVLLGLALDYPFAGDLAIGPEAFQEGALAPFWSP